MSFSSPIFLFYFLPLFLLIYNLISREKRNVVLLLGSCVFFCWGSLPSALLLFLTSILDYCFGNFISSSTLQRTKRFWMIAGIVENVGVLFYFKFWNFFIREFNQALSLTGLNSIAAGDVLLPLGISFFTFHKISYLVDVYLNKVQPPDQFWDFAVYVTFFPKLIQGPIVPYHHFVPQLPNHVHTLDDTFEGLFRFCIGLGKKILIADVLGEIADNIFHLRFASMTCGHAWLGILCYTFQIYFDFAGYSDMAIGIGRMLGFTIPENFNQPYLAQNFQEFWRRWHMTLSAWFKEYLYIPLGGNRVSPARNYLNLWIVFFVSGLWHGANWTFILWGIYHGFFIVVEKRFGLSRRLGKSLSISLTFFLIMVGWVFFRSENLGFSIQYLAKLFLLSPVDPAAPPVLLTEITTNRGMVILCIAFLISFIPRTRAVALWGALFPPISPKQVSWLKMSVSVTTFILALAALINSHFKPFIYFRF
jgi:alginate O-acetyltransferase complex protein AlgI